MLCPDEILGLAGRSLEGRVRRALHHLPPDAVQALDARLRGDARDNDLVYEWGEHGEQSAVIRIFLRPLCLLPEQLSYLHHVSLSILDALKRLPEMYLSDKHVRRTLPLSRDEDAFLREVFTPTHRDSHPLFGRLDAVCDLGSARWRDTLKFLEPNLSGVGGIHIAPVAESLVMRDVVPILKGRDPGLHLELPRDQRDLFLQLLLDHAQTVGRAGRNLCLLEPKYQHGGPQEQSALCRHLRRRHGVTVVHADPRELRLRNGEVYYGDTQVDVLYRDYEVRDLLKLRAETGCDLSPLRLLFRQNRVVSSIGGELDHKSGFELLTDPDFVEPRFSAEKRRIFARHILWTRLVYERRTRLPDGRKGDLLEFARTEREHLALKPNRGYGGAGILLGPAVTPAQWDTALDEALRCANDPQRSWVVQRLTELPVGEFPVIDAAGQVHEEPFYTVLGFAPTDEGLGVLCRASQRQVVNVAQRGGVCAVLLGHPPESEEALRGPAKVTRGPEVWQALRQEIATLRHLDATIDLLGWDEETYLPTGARGERGEQLATLEGLRHKLLASPWLGDLVAEAQARPAAPETPEAIELRLLWGRRGQALALSAGLIRTFAEARSRSLASWEEARTRRDFTVWAPALREVVKVARERATALAGAGNMTPYDVLLDEHDEGMTRPRVAPVLEALCARLVPMAREVAERAAGPFTPVPWLAPGRYPEAKQEGFCRELLVAMGFDFSRGRLDRSTHPFTLAAGTNDVRMTIRASQDSPLPAILATLHEGGHGLYDQGFDPAHRHTLLGQAPGMAIHESQARLWENLVGRGGPFWTHFFPRLRALFPEALGAVEREAFLLAMNRVRPGPSRVEADEVTYNLHILLRFELEVALLDGQLAVDDLPAAFRERMQALLGLVPADDLAGCLQDVHWALGAFGYFPSYTLGNLYAAQLYEAWQHQVPDGEAALARGDLAPLLGWLRQHVHRPGHLYRAEEIIRRATGSGLNADPFLRHLERKYLNRGAQGQPPLPI